MRSREGWRVAVGEDGDAKGWMACMQNEDGGMEPCQWFLVAQTFDCWSPQGLSLELTGATTCKISGGRRFQALSPHLSARRCVCSLIKLDLGPWQFALGGQEIVQTFQASATEPHRARHLKSHGWKPIGTARDASCKVSAIVAHKRPFIVLPMQSALQQPAPGRVIFSEGSQGLKAGLH